MIAALHVSYRVGRISLVDDVSVVAPAGEVLAIVGPNGAGKSTLLRLFSGKLEPTSGQIVMGKRPLGEWSIRERARARAVLPQASELTFPLAAREVVLLGRSPHIVDDATTRDREIANLAMLATDTACYADRAYTTLSGGERQRVHAARVFGQIWEKTEFRVLLLDEPTASLDLARQHELLRSARRMADDGCAVVCVLHDINLAAQYADTIVALHEGRIAAAGPPVRVLSSDLLAKVFRLEAMVIRHPVLGCPYVIPQGPARPPQDSLRRDHPRESAVQPAEEHTHDR